MTFAIFSRQYSTYSLSISMCYFQKVKFCLSNNNCLIHKSVLLSSGDSIVLALHSLLSSVTIHHNRYMVQWFNGLFHPIITKTCNNKCKINHMREQMLDEDPAKREAWSAESSALIYTTRTLKLRII